MQTWQRVLAFVHVRFEDMDCEEIGKLQLYSVSTKLNGTHQLLAYADDVNLL
jgi:hypothetical protein